jgi:outer membrane lipoprotein-sorting protein
MEGNPMRRLLLGLIFAPLASGLLTTVLAVAWLRDPHAEFDTKSPPPPEREPGQPDDIFLENPQALALATGTLVKAPLPLPSDAEMEKFAKDNPIAFLKYCLRRYDYDVRSYRLTFKKQERIGGKLQESETIAAQFRDDPFSVRFEWTKGARLAKKLLFVRGENGNQMLVVGKGLLSVGGVVKRDPEGEDAKNSSRYPITEFGLKTGAQRSLAAWENARKDNALHVEYAGKKEVPELGNRVCYVFKRTKYAKPEEDGISAATVYIDKETWQQVGITLKNADGDLIAEYWFCDITFNPQFNPDTFKKSALE